jgi:NADP-dependent 3-hydroxy acid dehydrogenase YdfG
MKKVIFLTGASSGIGKATVERLVASGHFVFMTARSTEALATLANRFPEQTAYYAADVCVESDMRSAFDACIARFKRVDALVNNAGMGIFDPLIEAKLSDWHRMVDVNIKGLLTCTFLALPQLRANRGQLINIASVAAHHVFANSGVYCSTKHAVLAISESIRIELGNEIRVTSISPGSVNTPFIDQTHNQRLLNDYKGYFAAGLSAEEVARQIGHAIDAPDDTVISEIILRPFKKATQ